MKHRRGQKLITEIQKEWLIEDEPHPKDYKLYHKRIQDRLNKGFEMLLWLAKNRPDILLNQVQGTTRLDEPRHKRLQQLLLIIKILKPELDITLETAREYKKVLEGMEVVEDLELQK